MLDSGAIILAGVLFTDSGFFTDILAILLLLPEARRWIWRGISFGMRRKTGVDGPDADARGAAAEASPRQRCDRRGIHRTSEGAG